MIHEGIVTAKVMLALGIGKKDMVGLDKPFEKQLNLEQGNTNKMNNMNRIGLI